VGSRSERPAPVERVAGGVPQPTSFGRRRDEPFPSGIRVRLSPQVRWMHPTLLFGGMPARMLRLSARGAALLRALDREPVGVGASGRLARKLTDANLAVPHPPALSGGVDVTVVVPVRDRAIELEGCLAALGSGQRVVVVDDGSADAEAVASACRRHGAHLVRRRAPGGPAAARNAGLRTVTSDLVAFVDSDCIVAPGWLESLAAHFVDPLVAGVAPRIVGGPGLRGSALVDMGSRAASVHPRSGVTHLPAAAVVFRRAPLGDGFDERFRYGEDVDLVWRLVEAGWRVRYVPDVEVTHLDPIAIGGRLRRRFAYGTSVGALERAHPGSIDHLDVGVGPACAVGGLLAGSPGLAALAWAATAARLHLRLRPLSLGPGVALRLSVGQVFHAWVGLGRWCTIFGLPLFGGSLLLPRGPARRARRSAAVLIVSSSLARRLGTDGGTRRVVVDDVLGDLAYGLGVVTGCVRAGVLRPLLPRVGGRRWPRS
jgi:mycofactocin glycosyltransferase